MKPLADTKAAEPLAERPQLLFLLVLLCLYFAQGLPFGLLAKALPALARDAGTSRIYIGLLALPAAPWALKFLWAPLVDRLGAGKRGHRTRWIISCQLLAAILLFWIAGRNEAYLLNEGWWQLLLLLTALNALCATQDIATDGLATRLLPARWRGLGNSAQVMGYKAGLVLGGASILMLVGLLGWEYTLMTAGCLLVLLLLPLIFWQEPLEIQPVSELQHLNHQRQWVTDWLAFMRQRGIWSWLLVLAGYRTGEEFGAHMVKPWLVDRGWSLLTIGQMELVAGVAGLLSALLAGYMIRFLPRRRMLLIFAIFQVLMLLVFSHEAGKASNTTTWVMVISLEVIACMAAVVLMTLMMDRCRVGHEGSDFTIQASIQLLITGGFILVSGASASLLGYHWHFMLAACLAATVIIPILFLPAAFDRLSHAR